MIEPNMCVRRSPGTASRVVGGEAIVLTPLEGKILTLNPTGTRIWEMLEGDVRVAAVIGTIQTEYAVPAATAAADVQDFLESMLERGMIEAE